MKFLKIVLFFICVFAAANVYAQSSAELKKERERINDQLDQLKKEYASMVLFAYRNKSAYNKLMFIFAAKDFNQAYKRLKYLQQFATYRERQASYIEDTQHNLHVKINELDKTKEEKHTL